LSWMQNILVAEIEKEITVLAGDLLRVDLVSSMFIKEYGIEEGKKSVAFSLVFRDAKTYFE